MAFNNLRTYLQINNNNNINNNYSSIDVFNPPPNPISMLKIIKKIGIII